jgi:hypothetical protein
MDAQLVDLQQRKQLLEKQTRLLEARKSGLTDSDSPVRVGRDDLLALFETHLFRLDLRLEQIDSAIERIRNKRSAASTTLDNADLIKRATVAYNLAQFDLAVDLLELCKSPLPANYDVAVRLSKYRQRANELLREAKRVRANWTERAPDWDRLRSDLSTFLDESPPAGDAEKDREKCRVALERLDAILLYHQLVGPNAPSDLGEWLEAASSNLIMLTAPGMRAGLAAALRRQLEDALPEKTTRYRDFSNLARTYEGARSSLLSNPNSKTRWSDFLTTCRKLDGDLTSLRSGADLSFEDEIAFAELVLGDSVWPVVAGLLSPSAP